VSCFGHAPAIRILPSPGGAQTQGRGMVNFEPVQRSLRRLCGFATWRYLLGVMQMLFRLFFNKYFAKHR